MEVVPVLVPRVSQRVDAGGSVLVRRRLVAYAAEPHEDGLDGEARVKGADFEGDQGFGVRRRTLGKDEGPGPITPLSALGSLLDLLQNFLSRILATPVDNNDLQNKSKK